MDRRRDCKRLCILLLYFSIAATLFTHCDARRSKQLFKFKGTTLPRSSSIKAIKKLRLSNHLNVDPSLGSTNAQPYGVISPFTLLPFESSGPIPLPESTTPNCLYPPPTSTTPTPEIYEQPPPPPTSDLTPILPNPSPPPGPPITVLNPPECYPTPNPPESGLSPPEIVVPSPPEYYPTPIPPESGLNPPGIVVPNPPEYEPSPPGLVPSPPEYVPSPTVFLPPVVYPLPNVPPPSYTAPVKHLWCVAKPTVPDPIIQESMDYACGSGADCGSIQADGSCFQPDTLYAHASYAFNSYWQRTKAAGGTCDFGGTAILVTMDPSYDGCHFIYS
ncbi:leucine-rich repeat extensin-like protein 2 [Macadamia integrifolia]|uniref:leucine-rich repeat extensin-like protein 2 n=1 Tax=Macadamia integrifolia TaxID=60698 RepID=UPI001C4F4A5F|nr:leucine-rich repeat extensin-like protein 2 [Macadamia integrifolia]